MEGLPLDIWTYAIRTLEARVGIVVAAADIDGDQCGRCAADNAGR